MIKHLQNLSTTEAIFMKIIEQIEKIWQKRTFLLQNPQELPSIKNTIHQIIDQLDRGDIRIAKKNDGNWHTNEWIKKAILLYFLISDCQATDFNELKSYDKIPLKFANYTEKDFAESKCRVVPGAIVRKGAFIGAGTILMPCFVNIGAYIGPGTMIDTWATVGSCAQIGANCHISGGTGVGGVLEPLQAHPAIIEDNCFIGARSEIAEGVIVGEGSVISMGVFIGSSTKIIYRNTGEIIYGKIPPYSVIVPGTLPAANNGPSLACAIIIKQVDDSTRSKTSINELLRG